MLGYDRDGMENGEHLFLLLDGWHVDLTEEEEEELIAAAVASGSEQLHRQSQVVSVCVFVISPAACLRWYFWKTTRKTQKHVLRLACTIPL